MARGRVVPLLAVILALLALSTARVYGMQTITIWPSFGHAKVWVKVYGYGFAPRSQATVYFDGEPMATTYTGENGELRDVWFQVPADAEVGYHLVTVRDEAGNVATVPFKVTLAMVTVTPEEGPAWSSIVVNCSGLAPCTYYMLLFDGIAIGYRFKSDDAGTLVTQIPLYVPMTVVGQHRITLVYIAPDEAGGGCEVVASTAFNVTVGAATTEDIARIEERITALEERVGALEEEVSALGSSVSALENAISDILLRIESINASLSELKASVESLNSSLTAAVEDLSRRLSSLKDEVAAINLTLSSLSEELRAELDAVKHEVYTSISELNQSLLALKAALSEMRSDVYARLNDLYAAVNNVSVTLMGELREVKAGVNSTLAKALANVETVAEQVKNVTARVVSVEGKLGGLSRLAESLSQRVNSLTAAVAGFEEKLKSFTVEIQGARPISGSYLGIASTLIAVVACILGIAALRSQKTKGYFT